MPLTVVMRSQVVNEIPFACQRELAAGTAWPSRKWAFQTVPLNHVGGESLFMKEPLTILRNGSVDQILERDDSRSKQGLGTSRSCGSTGV